MDILGRTETEKVMTNIKVVDLQKQVIILEQLHVENLLLAVLLKVTVDFFGYTFENFNFFQISANLHTAHTLTPYNELINYVINKKIK